MFRVVRRVSLLSAAKKTLIAGLVIYCGVTTVLLFRLDPKPIIIGIDSYGTRVIREPGDSLLKKERDNFLKRFLSLLYNYDSQTFEQRISEAGDLMSEPLWTEKRDEFSRIASQLKTEDLVQAAEVVEIREIDDWNYQADIAIRVLRKLKEAKAKLRIDIQLKPNLRSENNPYPYEVEHYDELQAP